MVYFQEITLSRTKCQHCGALYPYVENEESICCECRRFIAMANTLYATNEKLLDRLDKIIGLLEANQSPQQSV